MKSVNEINSYAYYTYSLYLFLFSITVCKKKELKILIFFPLMSKHDGSIIQLTSTCIKNNCLNTFHVPHLYNDIFVVPASFKLLFTLIIKNKYHNDHFSSKLYISHD